jgi:hypothetical protein
MHKANHDNQTKKQQNTTKTTRKSPSQICVSPEKTAKQTSKGARAQTQTKTHTRFAKRHSGEMPLCHQSKTSKQK